MSKLAIIGLVVAVLGLPISASADRTQHRAACVSISEMVPCGKLGVRGDRAQFMAAVTRPVEHRAFLWQLAH
jgi:hypothetical protein